MIVGHRDIYYAKNVNYFLCGV